MQGCVQAVFDARAMWKRVDGRVALPMTRGPRSCSTCPRPACAAACTVRDQQHEPLRATARERAPDAWPARPPSRRSPTSSLKKKKSPPSCPAPHATRRAPGPVRRPAGRASGRPPRGTRLHAVDLFPRRGGRGGGRHACSACVDVLDGVARWSDGVEGQPSLWLYKHEPDFIISTDGRSLSLVIAESNLD